MVRGLVIRQTFILIDLALAALVVVAVAFVAIDMRRVPPHPKDKLQGSELGNTPESSPLPEVGAQNLYMGLGKNGIFGEAGKWDPKDQPPPPTAEQTKPPESEVTDTSLNLKLLGTIAISPGNKFSSAFIENLDTSDKGRGYFISDTVMDSVTLEEVMAREVIVLNKRFNPPKRERLRMDEEDVEAPVAAKVPTVAAAPPNDSGTERIALKRDEIVQDIYQNYGSLVTNVKPEMAKDANGNVIGVTAPNIGQIPLAQKLGVQDNDVLQTVNNEKIDSEEKILEIVQKYQNATSFRIGIMRDGKPKVITYSLE